MGVESQRQEDRETREMRAPPQDEGALSDVTAGQIWLQMAHRGVAVLILCGVVSYFIAVRTRSDRGNNALRTLSHIWLVGVLVQLTLGAWVIWSNKAADIATTHVAVGAIMLSLGVAICAIALRLRAPTLAARADARIREEAHAF